MVIKLFWSCNKCSYTLTTSLHLTGSKSPGYLARLSPRALLALLCRALHSCSPALPVAAELTFKTVKAVRVFNCRVAALPSPLELLRRVRALPGPGLAGLGQLLPSPLLPQPPQLHRITWWEVPYKGEGGACYSLKNIRLSNFKQSQRNSTFYCYVWACTREPS